MMISAGALQPLVSYLMSRNALDQDAQRAILALPHVRISVGAGRYIIHEGHAYPHCVIMLKGIAFRHKLLADGGRQILGLHLQGEMIDLHSSTPHPATDNVQALTPVDVALIPKAVVLDLMRSHSGVGDAIWADTVAGVSVFREWLTNIGRRDARTRIAHFLCEFAIRQGLDVSSGTTSFRLPLTQTHFGDALGLTPVHVNRMLQALKSDGLIHLTKGTLDILNWKELARAGDFSARYLHFATDAPDRIVR